MWHEHPSTLGHPIVPPQPSRLQRAFVVELGRAGGAELPAALGAAVALPVEDPQLDARRRGRLGPGAAPFGDRTAHAATASILPSIGLNVTATTQGLLAQGARSAFRLSQRVAKLFRALPQHCVCGIW